jgi:hypothetical protein
MQSLIDQNQNFNIIKQNKKKKKKKKKKNYPTKNPILFF